MTTDDVLGELRTAVRALQENNIRAEGTQNSINKSLGSIEKTLERIEKEYVTRIEFTGLSAEVKKNSDALARVGWLVITAVLSALLFLVLKQGGA